MKRLTLFLLALFLAAPVFAGRTVIELSTEDVDLAVASSQQPEAVSAAGGGTIKPPGSNFSRETWIVPFVVDTENPAGTTTLFSINVHLAFGEGVITVEFLDEMANEFHNVNIPTVEGQVHPFNLRDQPGLGNSGLRRGFVRVTPTGEDTFISVDRFVVTPDQDYAAGGLAIDYVHRACRSWSTRVLVGGPFTGGTRLQLLINGPKGSDPADPVSVVGKVYDEEGDLKNSFFVRTDEWVVELDAADLIVDDELFGGLSLTFMTHGGDGYLTTEMGAEGRYSAGISGIRLD